MSGVKKIERGKLIRDQIETIACRDGSCARGKPGHLEAGLENMKRLERADDCRISLAGSAWFDSVPARDHPLLAIGGSFSRHFVAGPRQIDPQEELVSALVATGEENRASFARLYSLTSAKLFGICLRICGKQQAAEDVLQEVYATIWKRAAGYEPHRSAPMTWLATIARNRAIDWRRSRGRRPEIETEILPEVADAAPLASDMMLTDEKTAQLQACLDRLTSSQKDAIRMAFFEGLTYAELAERRGVPLGTMKSWVRRGLLRLRDCLDDGA